MPWTPESNDPLPGTISLAESEKSIMTLWSDFLSGYFNDDEHDLMGVGIHFPRATVVFQQAAHANEGLFIHVTAMNPGGSRIENTIRGVYQARNRTVWNIWVKALVKSPHTSGHNSESLCRLGSDRLYALLMSRDLTLPMHRKGISAIRPSQPKVIPSSDWSIRAMTVKGIISFDISAV